MKKRKNRIYLDQWLELKPYEKQCASDSYYLSLANKTYKAILKTSPSIVHQSGLDNKEIASLACFLTAYLEDLISGTNIWSTFVRMHKKLSGKYLPFYETDVYYEDEINLQDIFFLIHYFIHTIQLNRFISPFHEYILKTAINVFEIFDQAWDYAPENEYLKTFYTIDENEEDYYTARHLIDTVLFKTYLFFPDTHLELKEREKEIFQSNSQDENLIHYLRDNRDDTVQNARTRLLALKGQEWVAEIIGKDHNLSLAFMNISNKIKGYFFYKGQDAENIFIEHIASGRAFKLTKKSFDISESSTDFDTILFLGIVRWKNEWWFSGIQFQVEYNSALVQEERKSIQSRTAVDFLDHQKRNMDDFLSTQLKAFMEFNDGQQIAFMPPEKIESFLHDYMTFYNDTVAGTGNRAEKPDSIWNDGLFEDEEYKNELFSISEGGLVFFNPNSGPEIALMVNSAFPLQNNPFYHEDESIEKILFLFYSESFSPELVMFCLEHLEHDHPFMKSPESKIILDNLHFLLRFWKRRNFHTNPAVTVVGD